MKKYFFFFIVFVSLPAFWSCGSDSKSATGILQSAANTIEQYPDLALTLHNSIPNLYVLNDKELNRYRLLQIQAKDILYKNINKVNILEVQKKYDFELLQNANKRLLIERLWISFLSILVVVIMFFVFYRNHTLNREALLIARQQFYQLQEMVNERPESPDSSFDNKRDEINNQLCNTLFVQLDMMKKLVLVGHQLKEEEKEKGKKILEKVNEILYNSKDKFDWKIFYQMVDALYDNYLTRLRELYPKLNEEDIVVCCLSKVEFNNTEIALLTGLNQNIVQKRKSVIRKKIGMKARESFIKQLDEIVEKNGKKEE